MRPRLGPLVLAAGVLAGLAGCGERLRYADTIQVPLTVNGVKALPGLEAALPPDVLASLGGAVPETWPDDAPHVARDVPFEIAVRIDRADLGAVGEDLAAVGTGEAEIRVRAIDAAYDPGTLTHPLVAGTLWVAPDDAEGTADPRAERVGHLTGLDADGGALVFDPGGRAALAARFADPRLTLVVSLTLAFDTRHAAARPQGQGGLDLTVHADILR